MFPKVTNEKLLILSHWFDCCRMSLFFNVFLYKVRTFLEISWKYNIIKFGSGVFQTLVENIGEGTLEVKYMEYKG